MEEEIDLRPYIEALISKWYWIVGAAVVAGVVAFIVSSFLPPSYEATALVAVTQPTEIVEFDTRIRALEDSQPLKAYPEIAMSDDLMLALLPEVSAFDPEIQSVEDLRELVEAATGADSNLVRLTVTHGDPEFAAGLVNQWAELFVTKSNQIYGTQGGDQLRFYEQQTEAAAVELNVAEQALIAFQARNRASILGNQLSSLVQIQSDYLSDQRQIILLTQDVQALRDQLAQQPNNAEITFSDQLVSMSLQAKAFGAQGGIPVQFQLESAEALVNSDRAGQLDFLDALIRTLAARLLQIDEALAELEPRILTLQAEKQEINTESSQVQRDYTLAEETYTTLTRKVEEERITSQDTNSGVKLVGRTAVPEEPVGPRKLVNVIIAGMLGVMLAVMVILFGQWQRDYNAVETK